MPIGNACQHPGAFSIDLSEDDILRAMKSIQGYIDITPGDFNEIYQRAFRHAIDRFSRLVTAEQIMTKSVIAVRPETPLIETARLMSDAGISGVPVISDDNSVIGVISEKDFLRRMGDNSSGSFMAVIAQCLSSKECEVMSIRAKTAKDIMTAPAITARLNHTISELSRMLSDNHINRLPVADPKGGLLGIVSRGDIVNSFCAKL
jgi:CBS-domain-containing membrane protein